MPIKHPGGLPALLASLPLLFACVSCDPLEELEQLDYGDLTAPQLVSHTMDHQGVVSLEFDELVSLNPADLVLDPGLSAWTADGTRPLDSLLDGTRLEFRIKSNHGNLVPGSSHSLSLSLQDGSGNMLHMVLPFYGPNPAPARLLISEVAAKSSKTILDTLELQVLEAGNLGGLAIYQGFPEDFDTRYVFPALEVAAGDIILLHYKGQDSSGQGAAGETDETGSGPGATLAATGLNAHPAARDFWHPERPGLPDSSGILSVCETPIGPLQDMVFYCDKSTEAGKPFRSFGTSKLLRRAEYAQASGAWQTAGGPASPIAVEDAASSLGLTATRSLCRRPGSPGFPAPADTDSAQDWQVCQTGGISLGLANPDPAVSPKKPASPKSAGKAPKAKAGRSGKKAQKTAPVAP